MKNIHLLIIDPQNSFCDIPGAELPVPGANDDMNRLAILIDRLGRKIEAIYVTLDGHFPVHIAHPVWWRDQAGNLPNYFTIITATDVKNGRWTTRIPSFRQRSLEYLEKLERDGKYLLCIWPPHCLIGTSGHNVHQGLNDALRKWSEENFTMVDYIHKGSNPWTEHYGAIQAEVSDPADPSTILNTKLLQKLSEADIVLVAGEALSHCVKATVDQIGSEHIKKFFILTDCCSSIPAVPGGPDFPKISQQWLKEMEKRGMTLVKSTDFMVG